MKPTKMKRIAFITAMPMTLVAFMVEQINMLSEHYDITIYSNFSENKCQNTFPKKVKLVHIPFERKINFLSDIKCFTQLSIHLWKGQYDAIHSLIPKTGLLSMLAGTLCNTPIRIHTFTGQVWANKTGLKRFTLKQFDKFISLMSTHCLTDSPSQRDFLIKHGVLKTASVLGYGSISGVNIKRFSPNSEQNIATRKEYKIPVNSIIFGYLGRLNKDKGIIDLANAFANANLPSEAVLVLVGPDEENIIEAIRKSHGNLNGRLYTVGYTEKPYLFFNIYDVFCLPSYREGFGTSVIEAAACHSPSCASRIYGLTDAIIDGETGLLHEPGDQLGIQAILEQFATDAALRKTMGNNARKRVEKYFSSSYVASQLLKFYKELW